jgi:diguanylate cyclase (GGDEF)-like protein
MNDEERTADAVRPERAGGRVLLVDDSATIRKLIGGYLRRGGFEVVEAPDGRAALDMEAQGDYDVVLTDLSMPVLDGFGVLETIKSRATGPEVIILTGTAATDMASAVRALRLGAHDYLTKPPSNSEEVVLAVGRAIEKKRLRETNARLLLELEALSRTDPLTGLLNRRVLEESLVRELAQSRRYGHPLSLAMLDLDHFKAVNDVHGHQAGDQVLRTFAKLAQATFRDTDGVYRFGGEEFAALLPHANLRDALTAVNRVVAATANTPIPVGDATIRVTVSAGVACFDGITPGAQDLVAQADAALYQAKRAGRNMARAAEPLPVDDEPGEGTRRAGPAGAEARRKAVKSPTTA